MPAPIPVVTPIDTFLDLPAGGIVSLSCAASTVLPGALYEWQLIEAPDGSAATLQNANTDSPTLTNVDTRGTYIVFLRITDSGGSSHAQPYPVQSASPPYGFSTPLATAFGAVRVAESPSGLVKPGRGEYGWFEQGLWPVIAKVNAGLVFNRYDEPTRTLTANAVVPDATTIPGNELNLNGLRTTVVEDHAVVLSEASNGQIYIASETIVTDADLRVSGGVLEVDEINDASGGDLKIIANNAVRMDGLVDVYVTAPESVVLNSDNNIVRVTPTEVKIEAGTNLVSVRDPYEAEPDVLITAGATGADVVVSAAAEVRVTAGTDITLATTGTDGDIALTTQGATGNISLSTQGYVAGISVATSGTTAGISLTTTGAGAGISLNAKDDITLATSGGDGDITLSAPGASSSIALTATNGITVTSTGDTGDADIVLTSGKDVAAYATGLARLSGTTTEVIGVSSLSLLTDDGNFSLNVNGDAVNYTVDRMATVTFGSDNKRRVIDLDGYVAQRNHRMTAGGVTSQVTPNGAVTLVPLRAGVTADYTYEALCGASVTPNFVLAFRAAFNVTQFSTNSGHYLTFFIRCERLPLNPATAVTLAAFTFQPGGTTEVTNQPCVVSGTIHSTGSKALFTSGTASLQLDAANVSTKLFADTVDASVALDAGDTSTFSFYAISNDSNATIGNLSASFTLMRGS